MNELIYIMLIVVTMLSIFCMYKYSEKKGLTYILIILNLMSFILSFKISFVFKTNINLGIVPLIGSFTAFYLYILKYDDKDIKSIFWLILYANVFTGLLLVVLNYFIPTITDNISIDINSIFNNNYIILITYPLIAVLSQYAIYRFFKFIKEYQNNMFLTVTISYIITAIIYTVCFQLVSYMHTLGIKDALFIGIGTYINGLLITILSTVFIYYMTMTKKKVKK